MYDKEIITMLTGASKNLAQVVASSSFEFWQRKDFRFYVAFETISQTEQDRMFNELEVSLLGLFTLFFDDLVSSSEKEQKKVLQTLRDDLRYGFLELFLELGVEKKFIKTWEKLIDMRFMEYRKDFKSALQESEKWEEFKKDIKNQRVWARVETITIDCLSHIRRGDVKETDPLWKLLRKWFVSFEAMINPITELIKKDAKNNQN